MTDRRIFRVSFCCRWFTYVTTNRCGTSKFLTSFLSFRFWVLYQGKITGRLPEGLMKHRLTPVFVANPPVPSKDRAIGLSIGKARSG
jgi:hypothetical protein